MQASAEEPKRPQGGPEPTPPEAPPIEANAERALAASLAEAIPGFELLDVALELGNGMHVHFLGVDPRGHLVLVLVVAGDGENTPLKALDLLEFLGQQSAALCRHLQSPKLRPELAPRLVLLGERISARTLQRLASLAALRVETFELRQFTSRARQSNYLQRVSGPSWPQNGSSGPLRQGPPAEPTMDPKAPLASAARRFDPRGDLAAGESAGWSGAGPGQASVGDLGQGSSAYGVAAEESTGNGGSAPLAAPRVGAPRLTRAQHAQLAEVGQRLLRLDERIEQRPSETGTSFLLLGERLAQLEVQGQGPLRGSVPGCAPRLLGEAHEVELFLDEAVSEYLRRQDPAWPRPKTPEGA